MILTCGQCGTRFQLDERRIPSRGARVRCSKCNNAFFVRPPEVEAETTLQGLVTEAVAEAIPAPEPELDGQAPGDLDVTNPGLSEAMEPVGEVPPDEWTFEEEPEDLSSVSLAPGASASSDDSETLFGEPGYLGKEDPLEALAREVNEPARESSAQSAEASSPEAPNAPETSSMEVLGDPSEWDFLADSVPATPAEAIEAVPTPEVVKPAPAVRRQLPAVALQILARLAIAAGGLGWALSAGLVLAGLGQTIRVATAPVATGPFEQVNRAGVEVRELVARNLENLHAGPILVISGVVAPRRSGPGGLQVQLLDAAGRPLEGATAWAGPALAERALRELDPARLREDQGDGSDDLLYGGAFDAVFSTVPSGARGATLIPAEPPPAATASDRAATGLPRPPSPSPSQE